jgi:hypothetical protein
MLAYTVLLIQNIFPWLCMLAYTVLLIQNIFPWLCMLAYTVLLIEHVHGGLVVVSIVLYLKVTPDMQHTTQSVLGLRSRAMG